MIGVGSLYKSVVDAPLDDSIDEVSASLLDLPSGRQLDLRRCRWDGVLDSEEVDFCRSNGIALAYDPAQIGWVLVGSDRDVVPAEGRKTAQTGQPSGQATVPSNGITFRSWTEDDAATHRALLDDRAVWEHLPETYPEPFTEETSLDLILLANADLHHEVVAVEVDGTVVGQCLVKLSKGPLSPNGAEVAYWLGREHWGQGLMSGVLPAFVERCFDQCPVDTLYAWIRPENEASIRVAERSGFTRTPLRDEPKVAAAQDRAGFDHWAINRPN